MSNSKVYLSSPIKSIIPIDAIDTSTEVKELSKLSSNQITALSNKTGMSITSDNALSDAKMAISNQLSGVLTTANSLLTQGWEVLSPITDIVDTVISSIPGMDSLLASISSGTSLSSFQDVATALCEGINFDDLQLDFLNDKKDFENLLASIMELGDLDFLNKLFDCSLFDNQSAEHIKTLLPNIKDLGDVSMLKTILPVVGVDSLPNKIKLGFDLATNMKSNANNVTDLKSVLTSFDITPTSLMTNTTMGTTSLDLKNITTLSANGTAFVDDTFTAPTVKMCSVVSSMFC